MNNTNDEDSEAYFAKLCEIIRHCIDDKSDTQHAALVTFNSADGMLKVWSINTEYETASLMLHTAASVSGPADSQDGRVLN